MSPEMSSKVLEVPDRKYSREDSSVMAGTRLNVRSSLGTAEKTPSPPTGLLEPPKVGLEFPLNQSKGSPTGDRQTGISSRTDGPDVRVDVIDRSTVQPTLPGSGRGCSSSTPSAYSWMIDSRSLDCTAPYTASRPLLAVEMVRLANLWSMYLALMNSFLAVLQTDLQIKH